MYIQKCIKERELLLENHLDIIDKFIIPGTSFALSSKNKPSSLSLSSLALALALECTLDIQELETQASSLATYIFNTREEAEEQKLIYSTGTSVEKEKARKYLDKRQAAFDELHRLGVQKNILRATKAAEEWHNNPSIRAEHEKKMSTMKRVNVEEEEVKEVPTNRRGVKRQKKASPLYFTYRPLMSEDKDKAPSVASINNANESSNIVNQGSIFRARKMVGEEKWEVARELVYDGRIDYPRMSPDGKAFIVTRVALAKTWDRIKCCRFRKDQCACPAEGRITNVNSATYCCKDNNTCCAEVHNSFNRWDILVKGTVAYPET